MLYYNCYVFIHSYCHQLASASYFHLLLITIMAINMMYDGDDDTMETNIA